MGRLGKNRVNLGINTNLETVMIIDEHAGALNLSRSMYADLIIKKWIADNCPPVTMADDALRKMKASAKKDTQKKPFSI